MNKSDFLSLFKPDLFLQDMKSTTKEEALEELLAVLVDNSYIRNPNIFLEMLKRRETLGSTGIGKGVAIPHGRTVAASDVMIVFGKSDQGVEFDSIDGKPAHLFFMVISPPHDEGNTYLPILGRLVTCLNKADNRKALQQVEDFDQLMTILTGGE